MKNRRIGGKLEGKKIELKERKKIVGVLETSEVIKKKNEKEKKLEKTEKEEEDEGKEVEDKGKSYKDSWRGANR